ncbi:hypothetical protein [uncultured Cellulomonas sp.]|nr:hypothetical protein [uncultured Cellulomonas sp.]
MPIDEVLPVVLLLVLGVLIRPLAVPVFNGALIPRRRTGRDGLALVAH